MKATLLLRRGLGWLRRPRALPAKLRRTLRQWRNVPRYRTALARGELLVEAGPLPGHGLITVVMPVFRVAEAHLRAALASVAAQSWPHWELVIVDDAAPEPHVGRVLADVVADPRVRVVRRAANGGISVASNDAVAHACGEFVAFLDHDDELHPRALELAARFLAAHPATDWLFTDEDKIDRLGRHTDPILKPGWSRHLLLGCNIASHLRVVRREAIVRVGGHRPAFDGAQDYDLALRVLAAGGRFGYLPGPLYHWRTAPGSMAGVGGAKAAANRRALAALAEHARAFPRGGDVTAQVLAPGASLFRVRRAPDPQLRLALVSPAGAAPGALPPDRSARLAVAGSSPAALVIAARASDADVVLVPPPSGFSHSELAELLALLQVPGTAAASGWLVAGRRVVASGWVLGDDGALLDPWRGLRTSDPGYLNFALLPARRLVPPPSGWAAWRRELVAAWDEAGDVPEAWRLAAGWHRLGLDVVSSPDARWRRVGPGPRQPDDPPPTELPHVDVARLALIGALP